MTRALVLILLVAGCDGASETTCESGTEQIGDPAEGPAGWTAVAGYSQEADCSGAVVLALFAPGDSWESEALTAAGAATLVERRLGDRSRTEAWLEWDPAGQVLAFGTGATGMVLVYVEALPEADEPARLRACAGTQVERRGDGVEWDLLPASPNGCRLLGR